MAPHGGDNFYHRYRSPNQPGLPKYAQLRQAIIRALEEGYWGAGSKLPTEVELTKLTPFSLGTVQRAFRALVEEGIIERRQGHGSFVAEGPHEMEDPLHCRFLADDGLSWQPVFPRVVGRRRLRRPGPWAPYLGHRGAEIFCIDRVIGIGGEFSVFSSFYADAERLRLLLDKPVSELKGANFKALLRRELRLPVTGLEQTARVAEFPARVCREIGVQSGTTGMILQIAARSGSAIYVYYQELFIPPNPRVLAISRAS